MSTTTAGPVAAESQPSQVNETTFTTTVAGFDLTFNDPALGARFSALYMEARDEIRAESGTTEDDDADTTTVNADPITSGASTTEIAPAATGGNTHRATHASSARPVGRAATAAAANRGRRAPSLRRVVAVGMLAISALTVGYATARGALGSGSESVAVAPANPGDPNYSGGSQQAFTMEFTQVSSSAVVTHNTGHHPKVVDLQPPQGDETIWQDVVDAAGAANQNEDTVWGEFTKEVTADGGTVTTVEGANGTVQIVEVPDNGEMTSAPSAVLKSVGEHSLKTDGVFTYDNETNKPKPHPDPNVVKWGHWLGPKITAVENWWKHNEQNLYLPLKASGIAHKWDTDSKGEHEMVYVSAAIIALFGPYFAVKTGLNIAGRLVGAFCKPVARAIGKGYAKGKKKGSK
ncbi:MAG TPA: hypothetical protein VMB52_06710 [Verrucomicrobiae bacterium]|nr:hypothetical protein [Verrucomicrobiae bacterium]